MDIEDFSFFGRIKRKLKIHLIPEEEWNQMRRELLTDGKRIFCSVMKILPKTEIEKRFYDIAIKYYDERIKTLPKDLLYDLYTSYKSIDFSPDREMKISLFVNHLFLLYGWEGWFTKKLVEENFY